MRSVFLLSFCLISSFSICQTSVTVAEPMLEYRDSHGSAALSATQVLVAGGWNGTQVTSSAEYYDLTDDSWLPAASMTVARTNFAMCELNNGYVIATGGWDGSDPMSLSSSEIYHSQIDSWTAGPSLSVGRSFLVATKLLDGRILFTGGFDGNVNLAHCDIYDPVANSMTPVASMNFARSSHVALLLPDGTVLVAGGYNPDFGFQMDQCEIYNPFLDEWTITGSLNIGRDNLAGVVTPAGIAAVVGGRIFNSELNLYEGEASAEVYEPFSASWIEVSLPGKHSYNHLLDFANGYILSVSGTDQTGNGVTTTYVPVMSLNIGFNTTVELWDAATSGDQRFRSSAAKLTADTWVVTGGDDAGIGSADVWMSGSNVNDLKDLELLVFPNPSTDRFVITGEQRLRWFLVDMTGRIALLGGGNIVEVSKLPVGTYQLIAHSEQSVGFTKVQIKR